MMRKKMDGIGNDIRAVACSYDAHIFFRLLFNPLPFLGHRSIWMFTPLPAPFGGKCADVVYPGPLMVMWSSPPLKSQQRINIFVAEAAVHK